MTTVEAFRYCQRQNIFQLKAKSVLSVRYNMNTGEIGIEKSEVFPLHPKFYGQ